MDALHTKAATALILILAALVGLHLNIEYAGWVLFFGFVCLL